MNECFQNIIGIRANTAFPSDYACYVDSLPIVNWKFIADTAPEGLSGADHFSNTLEVAVNDIIGKVQGAVMPYFAFNNAIDFIQSGKYKDTPTYNTAFSGWRGQRLSQQNRRGCHNADLLGSIYISDFDYLGNTSGTIDFRMRDINGIIWTKQITGYVAGELITVQVNKSSRHKFVYIESNNTGIATANTKLGNCPGGCHVMSAASNIRADGFNGTSTGTEGFGIIVRASLVCDQERLNCMFRELPDWRQALLYQVAYNLLDHSIVPGSRTNPNAIRQLEDRKEQLVAWEIKIRTYLKQFRESGVKWMQTMQNKSGCITCTGGKYVG